MTKKHIVVLNVLLIAIIILTAAPVPAQEKAADDMQMVLQKVRSDKKLLVAQNMEFTEAEAKLFWPLYERYQDELFLLRARTMKMLDDYANSYEKLTNAIAKKLLDEYMQIETVRLKLHQYYLPKFRKTLPDTKVARYYQVENKIQAALTYELAKRVPLAKTNN
ncbi:MAG: hypothetical protein AB9866_30650 [Syntrophobacteraceae bacterium]